MNREKHHCNERWSLQYAILYTFGKYLSKKETLRPWSIGLDQKLSRRDQSYSLHYCKKLIHYACSDCVSVAHLNLFMQQSKIQIDMPCPNPQHESGECKIKVTLNAVPNVFQSRMKIHRLQKFMKIN